MKPSPAPNRGFPVAEFESRLSRAQQLMDRHGFAALWLTTEPEIRYFSGFLTQFWQSPTRPWFMVVPLDGKPIAVIPEIGARHMSATWLDDIRTWPAPFPEDDGLSLLSSALRQTAGRTGRIGILMGAETYLRMPLGDFETVRAALLNAGLDLGDATPIIRELRLVKSDAEIEKIAHICGLVSDAFAALPTLISIGVTERLIFRTFKIELLRRGADDVPYLVGGSGFDGYDNIISPPTGRATKRGDILMLDTGATFDGYFCDFDRNFAFDTPSDSARKAYEILYRATEAGLGAASPGATAATLFHSMSRELQAWTASANPAGRLGHGLGMQLTEWPSLTPSDETVLQPGMVITLEPALEITPGWLMVQEENIVIRDSGAELLTERAPRELPIIR